MWSQFAATPRILSPLSCCIIWSAIFPHVTLLCDQDRHGVYARRHLLNYSKAPLSLHVSFVVVSGGIRGPLTFTSFAREWTQVGLALLPVNGVEVRREADEEGDGEKRWVFSPQQSVVRVCVWDDLPTLHLLSHCVVLLWVLEEDMWRARLWPAEWHPCLGFHPPTPSVAFTPSCWPAAMNTYFLC